MLMGVGRRNFRCAGCAGLETEGVVDVCPGGDGCNAERILRVLEWPVNGAEESGEREGERKKSQGQRGI